MPFKAEDEFPHSPQDEVHWQESVWVQWFDTSSGIAGFHRIGHHPLDKTAVLWCGLLTEDGARYRAMSSSIPLSPEDRDMRYGAGPNHVVYPREGGPRVEVNEPDCELSVDFRDFYPVSDLWSEDNKKMSQKVAAGHFESSGQVTGTARLGDRTYTVDALGHRDHSWGIRHWDYVVSHRWCAGTFGPSLSFSSYSWHAADGSFFSGGYVVRDGRPTRAESVDIVVQMEADGLTHRGGEVTLRLPKGEEIRVTCTTVDGTLFGHRGVYSLETACRALAGDLDGGVCNLEMSNNPRRGVEEPTLALRANMTDGLTHT